MGADLTMGGKLMRATFAGVALGTIVFVHPGVGTATAGDEAAPFCSAFGALLTVADPPVGDGDVVTVLDAEQEAELMAWADDFEALLGDLVEASPEVVAPDMQVLGDGYADVIATIRSTDFGDESAVAAFNESMATWEDDSSIGTAFSAVFGYAASVCGDGASGADSCLLSTDEVASITGAAVTDSAVTVGGATIGSVELLETSTTEGSAPPVNELGWAGCSYETEDGTSYVVGELVGPGGEPDPGQFDRLAAAAIVVPEIADGAFATADGSVVVLAGDETLVFGVDTALDAAGVDLLTGVAEAMAVGEYADAADRCAWLGARIPEPWGGPSGEPAVGSGAEGDIGFETCSHRLSALDGARLSLQWSPGRAWFDARAADRAPFAVDGVGEAAYRFGDRLVVLAGGRAVVVVTTTEVDDVAVEITVVDDTVVDDTVVDDTVVDGTAVASTVVDEPIPVDVALATAALAALG